MNARWHRSFLAFIVLAAAGCGKFSVRLPALEEPPSASAAPVKKVPLSSDEAAIAAALKQVQASQDRYKISAADLLHVSVFQEKDFDREARVSNDGIITLPLIGKIKVGGLDVPSAEELLQDKLKKYLISPQASILIKEYGNKIIYILGEVQRPGAFPLPTEAPLSVVQAITLAGGFTQYASKDRTRVIRKMDGQSQSFIIEVTAITKEGDKSKDMVLQANDVIVVPETLF